jgi:DNA-binding CsgD family transcriptional regulator/tetratricopeptide (TPR) repeat protein
LHDALAAAASRGQIALVSGEAGIGKTSLVERFLSEAGDARVFWGMCEALSTPRPLGPLYDIAAQAQGVLHDALTPGADRTPAFAALFDLLSQTEQPVVLVVEDVHWADEATLDLITFLGRRIQRTRCLMVLTYREHELDAQHPLRIVLGNLPHALVTRLPLPPLSPVAVAALAQRLGRTAADLYALTGGNPFFVTEVLASDSTSVPGSVLDAVLARVARLVPETHPVLDLVAVVPARVELWLVEAVLAPAPAALDACTGSGMLLLERGALSFRHELARRALEGALPASRRRQLHALVLAALAGATSGANDLARLVHHAEGAEDASQVLALAPAAARHASALGAHREAARHYRAALTYADQLTPERHAELLEDLAYECYLISAIPEAFDARRSALAIWRRAGRREKEGHTLRWLSRLSWFLGDGERAHQYAGEAITLLEQLPPGNELALAYTNRSQVHMLCYQVPEAVAWGERALALATKLGEAATQAHALNNMGAALFASDAVRGKALLEQSLELSLAHALEEHAARAYTNLVSCATVERSYRYAIARLDEGIAYCVERDLESWTLYLSGWGARISMETGDWERATAEARAILARPEVPVASRLPALAALGRVLVRQGDPAADPLLHEAHELAGRTGELQRVAPVALARAEARWLARDLQGCAAELEPALALARVQPNRWELGELSLWLWRANELEQPPPGCPDAIVRQFVGDWRAAAQLWQDLGCPYERALALADGDEAALRAALAILEQLRAAPALTIVQQRLRALGVSGIPRGPRQSTQANPAGLTQRQIEVLRLLSEGLQNSAIAGRLHISPKTVDHHLEAIFAKLDVRSRAQAVAAAARLGLLG